MTTRALLAENARRQAARRAPYDPILGTGSPLRRVPVEVGGAGAPGICYVPEAMLADSTAAQLIAERKTGTEAFYRLRLKYDFEFFCALCVTIKVDAETRSRTGRSKGPFVLSRAQRLYLPHLAEPFLAGLPVRVILLKARQWGGSTLTQIFMAWVQIFHEPEWNAFICAQYDAQSGNIREMYETMARAYPRHIGTLTFRPYQGSQKIKQVAEHGGIVATTSTQTPDSPRSFTIHMAHLSEVGLWKSTPVFNAQDFAQAIVGAVPEEPRTIIVEESTAKGVGTYFHQHWQAATSSPKRSSYAPVFIPWYEISKYEQPVAAADVVAFAASWDEYEQGLWTLGATIESIRWYRSKLLAFKSDRLRMQSEYPSTPREAFQSTGRPVFTLPAVDRCRAAYARPGRTGFLKARAETGKDALRGITFTQDDHGDLTVWREPGYAYPSARTGALVPPGYRVAYRYAAFADFGGKSAKADYSVCTVIDRAPMLRGGLPEVAARLRCHMRPDLYAWASARLCAWYDFALLAYETNRHSRDRGDSERGYEPEWSYSALEEVGGVYPNLYLRTRESRIDEPTTQEIGFHTSGGQGGTKAMIITVLDAALEDEGFVEPDARAYDEYERFEIKPDGRMGAVEGQHDDIVISTAGALWLATHHMPPPRLVAPAPERPVKRAAGMATF